MWIRRESLRLERYLQWGNKCQDSMISQRLSHSRHRNRAFSTMSQSSFNAYSPRLDKSLRGKKQILGIPTTIVILCGVCASQTRDPRSWIRLVSDAEKWVGTHILSCCFTETLMQRTVIISASCVLRPAWKIAAAVIEKCIKC